MSTLTIDEYREWVGLNQDASEMEIKRACHQKYCELDPVGEGSTKGAKEEATQQQHSFAYSNRATEGTIVPFTFRYPPVTHHTPDHPLNDGHSVDGPVQLRPVYAHWLRESKGAFMSPKIVQVTDPRPDRFEDPGTAYSHSGGPYSPKRKADSETSQETIIEDDWNRDKNASGFNTNKAYRNSRGLFRAKPRGALREKPRGRRRER